MEYITNRDSSGDESHGKREAEAKAKLLPLPYRSKNIFYTNCAIVSDRYDGRYWGV